MSAGKKHLLTPTQKEEFRRLVDECNHDLHEIARRMNLSFTKVRNRYYGCKYHHLKEGYQEEDGDITVIEEDSNISPTNGDASSPFNDDELQQTTDSQTSRKKKRKRAESEEPLFDNPATPTYSLDILDKDESVPSFDISSPLPLALPVPIPNVPEHRKRYSAVTRDQIEVRTAVERMLVAHLPTFKDIIGQEEEKILFARHLVFPVKSKAPLSILSNMLLYGPPGAGKPHFVRAAAGESLCPLIYVNSTELASAWSGRMETISKEIIRRASEKVPSIILIDEAEVIFGEKADSRDKAALLTMIDSLGYGSGIVVLATSSNPWKLDIAFLARIRHNAYIRLPNCEEIELLLKKELDLYIRTQWLLSYSSLIDTKSLALRMEQRKFSRTDIKKVISNASDVAIKRLAKEKTYDQLKELLDSKAEDANLSIEILQEDIECAVENKKTAFIDIASYVEWGNAM